MSKTWRKRLGIGAAVIGGVALGAAGKDKLKGFATSAGETIGGLVGQLVKGRSLEDFFPNEAAVREAAEDLLKGTPAGKAATQEGLAKRLGEFIASPLGIGAALLGILGLVWLARR
jgi:hypothetical protein